MLNLHRQVLGTLVAVSVMAIGANPSIAAERREPGNYTSKASYNRDCAPAKLILNWSASQIERNGFDVELYGQPQASLSFKGSGVKYLSLDTAANPTNASYVASRITEADPELPVEQRNPCWQPSAKFKVVGEFIMRFDQKNAPATMTENFIFWNAPLGANGNGMMTAIGVSRTQGQYVAAVAQDLNLATYQGLYSTTPMPSWLDASKWHAIRVTFSQTDAKIEVAQLSHPYTVVSHVQLLHPPEALDFEFSVDNEAFPGFYAPITVPDGADISYMFFRKVPANW